MSANFDDRTFLRNRLRWRKLPSARQFSRLWAGFLLALLAVTFRVWFPLSDFPEVPLVAGVGAAPRWCSWLAAAVVTMAATAVVINPRRFRWAWLVVAGGLLIAILLDQHRLQPWAYQTAVYALVFASMSATQARRWLIPLAASVYIYSAAGKFDFQFVHTVGQNFLAAVAAPVGGLPEWLGESTRTRISLLLPVTELSIGFGLLIPSLRRLAGCFAIAMHLALVALLGPWALDHSLGVLIWNLALLTQAWCLFVAPAGAGQEADDADHVAGVTITKSVAQITVIAALLMPLSERWGYWDHWPSWALYSPHSSRVDLEFHGSVTDQLPRSARRFIARDDDGDGWSSLSLDDWSLQVLGVPIYPQSRYHLALAVSVAKTAGIDRGVRGVLKGTADRGTGQRVTERMIGRTELRRAMNRFWLTAGQT